MSLRFEPTGLRVDRQDPPWKIIRAFGPLVHLHNVSGGVLAGDRLALNVEVAPGVAAQLTTTGATRLYRHRPGAADSEQSVTISAGENALLEYLPDPVIPFRGSRHQLRTSISLAPGATLFWWEVLAPGRLAAGERFAFERLRTEISVRAGERLVLREDSCLEPGKFPLTATARMGEYSHVASFYACRAGAPPPVWRELEEKLNQAAMERSAGELWGASRLVSDGVMVRGLASTGRNLSAALTGFWRIARRFLTGEDAAPPRKVY